MKKLCFLLLLAGWSVTMQGQVLINLQLPPSGIMLKNQLWNLSLVNTSNTLLNVQVEVNITDISNNQRVLAGTTRLFQLPKGIKQVQANEIMPVTYNVLNNGYGINASQDGFLPIGTFNICYTVLSIVSDASERLAEECETVEIEPVSPPFLISPSDSEHVDIFHPFFTWIPPMPYYLFNNLLYDWTLVEVQPMQTGAAAIQQNIPLLSQSNLSVTNFQYPLAQPDLDTSKLYAWQVTAKNNTSAIAKSEIWTFRVRQLGMDTNTSYSKESFYAKLKPEENASFVLCFGVLKYAYLNEQSTSRVQITITDISTPVRRQIDTDSTFYTVVPGQNFKFLDLRDKGLTEKHIYLLDLINSSGLHWYLKFEFRKPDSND